MSSIQDKEIILDIEKSKEVGIVPKSLSKEAFLKFIQNEGTKRIFGLTLKKITILKDDVDFIAKVKDYLKVNGLESIPLILPERDPALDLIPAIQAHIFKDMGLIANPSHYIKNGVKAIEILQKFPKAEQGYIKKALEKLIEEGRIRLIDITTLPSADQGIILTYGKTSKILTAATKQIYVKKDFEKWLGQQKVGPTTIKVGEISAEVKSMAAGGGVGGAGAAEETPSVEVGKEMAFAEDCTKFPSLVGIVNFLDQAKAYFTERPSPVYISEKLLRKMLLALERDSPLVLYGEPGDGKSLIIKTFMDWLTCEFNANAVGDDYGWNPNLNRKERLKPHQIAQNQANGIDMRTGAKMDKEAMERAGLEWDVLPGTGWLSMNIDESTSPVTLYGGYAPEALTGKAETRMKNVEWGIISNAIRKGRYIFLDELNRTENEVLGRMMGFLQEPYSYDVPEGRTRFILKNPEAGIPRSNLAFLASMNIGDVGNFKMSFAFKRRFKIVQVHYEPREIISVLELMKDYREKEIETLKNLIENIDNKPSIGAPTIDDVIRLGRTCYQEIAKLLYSTTREWADRDQITQFGIGVAHIASVLKDISLYLKQLVLRKKKDLATLEGFASAQVRVIKDPQFQSAIVLWVGDAVRENVIMALVDENDKFKLTSMEDRIKKLCAAVAKHVQVVFDEVISKLFDVDAIISETSINQKPQGLALIVEKVFKF